MRTKFPFAVLTLTVLSLGGCSAANDGFPSLLPRPIESRDKAEPVRPDPVATPDAALDTRIGEKRAAAAAAAKRFQEASIAAESRVAVSRGVPEGSEAWVAAQSALAELDTIRGETVGLVTELEEEAAKRAQAGTPAYPSLDAAIAEIGGLATRQAGRAKALEDALGS